MEIFASDRFMKAYSSASLGLKDLAEGTIHDFVRRQAANPATVLRNYDRLAHLQENVLELDLSSSHRLLATYAAGQLTLLDMGVHEVVDLYTKKKLISDLSNRESAPNQFWPGRGHFFRRNPDESLVIKYDVEGSNEWLYFLEKQQSQVYNKIESIIWKAITGPTKTRKEPQPIFILGGPGTGKTCILLNLLRVFGELEESFRVQLEISKPVTEYIEKSTNANLAQYKLDRASSTNLRLIDDPSSVVAIKTHLDWFNSWKQFTFWPINLVIAFDPLQLDHSLSDEAYRQLISDYDVRIFSLSTCYRQKQNVGRETKHIMNMIADSTPFLDETKIDRYHNEHEALTAMANELTFVNPAGYVQYYPEATVANLKHEVAQILQNEWRLWSHFPGLLVVEYFEPGYTLSKKLNSILAPLQRKNFVKRVNGRDLDSIKGLEFQYAFIFMDKFLFKQIQEGFSGTGRSVYNERRRMRIPFSRAKDRLVTFALGYELIDEKAR